ncbi:hypothetical protein PS15m_008516 [Mucor circinelloides]
MRDVAVSTKKDLFLFRCSIASTQSKRPKITDKTIDTLSPDVSIVSDQYLTDQLNLLAFKQYPTAHKLLVKTMDAPLSTLPYFLWTFGTEANTNSGDLIFVNIIRCTLADFYSKRQRNPQCQPKYEGTFWVDRAVPIFQALGDHSQLLGFQWCEVPTEEYAEFTIDPTTWKPGQLIYFSSAKANAQQVTLILIGCDFASWKHCTRRQKGTIILVKR